MFTGTTAGYLFLGGAFLINMGIWVLAQRKEGQIGRENAESMAKLFLVCIILILLTNILNLAMLLPRAGEMKFVVPSLVLAVFSILKVRPRAIRCYAQSKRNL